jgi:hypothetical protein
MAPLVAAQVGIAMTLLRRTRPNRTLWITSIALVIVDALVCSFVLLSKGWMAGWLAPASFYLWFGLVDTPGHIWLFCAAPAYLIFVVYNWFVKQAARETSPERRKLIKAAGGIAIASPFAVMAFGVLVGRFDFQVREVDVPIANLHPDLDGLRILQLSDVHLGEFLSEQQFSRAIDMCDGLHPHLAIMTGDLITRDQDPVDACIRQLARVKSDAGMLGCLKSRDLYQVRGAGPKGSRQTWNPVPSQRKPSVAIWRCRPEYRRRRLPEKLPEEEIPRRRGEVDCSRAN